jgi:hypothetical protein
MKRKTNLFYTEGVDSKFLTFSNYTEAMTGNYLSTNIKLFPTLFLCVNLNIQDKEGFIKNDLVGYYENKLATLRDARADIENYAKKLNPLGYLLDCIFKVDSTAKITYIGNITEQDYNGIYTDTICTINPNIKYIGNITTNNSNDGSVEGDDSLRGWYNSNGFTGPDAYIGVEPTFDDGNNLYNINSNRSLTFEKKENETENNSIVFNVIIPLFSVVDIRDSADLVNYNINYNSSSGNIQSNSTINVPLGIWFANNTISLSTDGIYGQNWSLVIGSQFKPFPTSVKGIPTEIEMNNTPGAYNSFAQVLARQDSIIKFFSEQILELKNQIKVINENLGAHNSFASILSRQDSTIKSCLDQIEKLKNQINEIKNPNTLS